MKKSLSNLSDKGSTERFGYEWNKYAKIIPEYETQFLKWVNPLTKKNFKGKAVLDAGCGMGRNSYWPLLYGARKVLSIDYNKKTLASATKNLAKFKNCTVLYKSIYDLNEKSAYDVAFSIGVIHHLEFPKKAVQKLVDATRPGGKIVLWVYGYEGNEWIVRYINPLRKITSRLPLFLVEKLSYLFSIPLYAYVKLVPQSHSYLKQLSSFRLWHTHSIVFDQLIPKIANYWKKNEAMALFDKLNVKNVQAFRVNNNSWTVIATKS